MSLALTACGGAIRPAIPPAVSIPTRQAEPSRAPTTAVGAGGDSAIIRDRDASGVANGQTAAAPRGAATPDSVEGAGRLPDSLSAALADVIEQVSKAFDVPDSVMRGLARGGGGTLVDVDSLSGVGGDEPTWDIEVDAYVTQEKVARYVDLFLGASRPRFVERLQRGKQYEPMIRAKFRAAGIPEDMYFLALVESGYDPHAYSRAAAVGMWQFMSSTARGVGLRVDWWIDERRDPIKSTDAAARFIRDLRGQFGSLYLAAAAYNGGPGRVSRGLKMFDEALDEVNGDDCFFALAERDYLRAETKNYVPQLIAAALIGKAPSRYGIQLDSVAAYAYDSVVVPGATPLAAVARAADVGVRDLQRLNPHLLRGVTPPGDSMPVRLPVGSVERFTDGWEALPDSERVAFVRTTTRKGETLAAFAGRYDVQPRQVSWFNPRLATRRGRLVAGQSVLVPKEAVLAAALDVPDPSIERYGSSAVSGGRTVHVVRRGESLGSIAKKYRTSVASLVRLNRLRRQVIYPGQTIIVRGAASRRSTSSARLASRSTRGKSTAARSASSKSSAKPSTKRSAASKAKSAPKKTGSSKAKATAKAKGSATPKASAKSKGGTKEKAPAKGAAPVS